jgi:hypothetical protein
MNVPLLTTAVVVVGVFIVMVIIQSNSQWPK